MATSTPLLLGPPEIYQESTATAAGDMVANYNKTAIYSPPGGLTENFSPTFLSTGNACLDFFYHVVPTTPPEVFRKRLQLAWDQNKLKALKLICNLRGVRGTGKSDREGFYTAALWLHDNHPKTLAYNVASFAEFGCFKDLPEILFRLLEGADARKLEKQAWETRKMEAQKHQSKKFSNGARWRRRRRGKRLKVEAPRSRKEARRNIWRKYLKSGVSGEEKRIEKAKKVIERFNRDPDFKFLHERISDTFAQFLRSDMKLLNSGDSVKISLAAKWCPSLDSSFDRATLLCESIARKVFHREEFPEYEGVEEAHYAYRVRDRLRKEIIVPLRKALQLPEVYIGGNDWGSIPYERVPSVAMKLYKYKFIKHDSKRYDDYDFKVRSRRCRINGGALLPHEIIDLDFGGIVAETYWKERVADLAKQGKLNNCLAICDVSGRMHGTSMDVAVALGILVSELSQEPWKGKLITFSENPKVKKIVAKRMRAKIRFVKKMERGMKINFQKVFDLLLRTAVRGKLRPDQTIKRLFVLSNMEFDKASEKPWETEYEAIVRKFREKGYGESVPEIVFWNLRESGARPVLWKQPGLVIVGGFSKKMMKLFFERNGDLDPEAVMDASISGEYQKLVVID